VGDLGYKIGLPLIQFPLFSDIAQNRDHTHGLAVLVLYDSAALPEDLLGLVLFADYLYFPVIFLAGTLGQRDHLLFLEILRHRLSHLIFFGGAQELFGGGVHHDHFTFGVYHDQAGSDTSYDRFRFSFSREDFLIFLPGYLFFLRFLLDRVLIFFA